MRFWRPLVLLSVVGALLAPQSAEAITKLEGEYQFQIDLRKQDRRFVWDFDSNNDDTFNLMSFRLFSQPTEGVEAFTKFEAEWNTGSNNNARPQFQYREAHLRFRKDYGGKGFDSYLFSRQNRFWVDNHLIRIVDGEQAKDGDNAHGARVDMWGPNRLNFSFIASDFSSQGLQTDDAFIARLRKEWWDGKFRTGATWNRKNTRLADAERFVTEVFGLDFRYRVGTLDFSLEYAEGQQRDPAVSYRSDDFSPTKLSLKHPGDGLPDDSILKGEFRSLRFGNPDFGYFNVAPSFWYLGPNFRNQLGDGNNDEVGYFINTWYLVPARAVTWTNNYLSYVKRVNQSRHVTEFLSEAYIEYVNGFTSKIFYRNKTTRDYLDGGATKQVQENDDLFAEMQVENRLAWLRVQFRIRDIDTVFQKELSSIETSVNVTETIKLYNRFTFGDDPARSRKGLFSQLQYRPRPNFELFLSYGPDWIGGGSNPVFEGNLEGNADNKDLVKLIMKGIF
ncbi:MAG: hypothetical protein HKN21_13910 [Candidatus Eisenbacteria bacterium]|uniref:Alginate export domain-containing protein n=1 Tax=Eiseniibacteriota bacterium TaxID=2212470 RepID=A0A7Y2EDJ0_UNCEI|nr:hypothetical protein [Candidatus Eisenbacteria bacterium]